MSEILARLNDAFDARYRVVRELGGGGMATVFLADDLRHRRPVAIKVLDPQFAAFLGAERFLKEIEVTAGLRHPHILPLYDSGRTAIHGLERAVHHGQAPSSARP
jgi:eukaryotic-like serine/threonine-protein kinase